MKTDTDPNLQKMNRGGEVNTKLHPLWLVFEPHPDANDWFTEILTSHGVEVISFYTEEQILEWITKVDNGNPQRVIVKGAMMRVRCDGLPGVPISIRLRQSNYLQQTRIILLSDCPSLRINEKLLESAKADTIIDDPTLIDPPNFERILIDAIS